MILKHLCIFNNADRFKIHFCVSSFTPLMKDQKENQIRQNKIIYFKVIVCIQVRLYTHSLYSSILNQCGCFYDRKKQSHTCFENYKPLLEMELDFTEGLSLFHVPLLYNDNLKSYNTN